MAKKLITALRCKNYKEHLAENDKHPDRQTAPLFIRSNMIHHEGWQRSGSEWLCSDCVKNAGNWGLRGDMV